MRDILDGLYLFVVVGWIFVCHWWYELLTKIRGKPPTDIDEEINII